MLIQTSLLQTLLLALPAVIPLSLFIVAWIVTYRFSLQRQSRGLLMISRGFLIKIAIDGAWDVYFYAILGGTIGIINSVQNQSAANIGETLALYFYIGIGTSAVSLALMILFIIYGALKMTSEQRVGPDQTAPTVPTFQ